MNNQWTGFYTTINKYKVENDAYGNTYWEADYADGALYKQAQEKLKKRRKVRRMKKLITENYDV